MFGQVSVTSLILAALGSEGAFQMWGALVSFQVSAILFILNSFGWFLLQESALL